MRDAAFRTSRGATSHSSVFRSASETRRPSDLSSRRLLPPPRPIPSLSNTARPRRLSPRAPHCIARPRVPPYTAAPLSPSAPQPRSSSPPTFWVAGGRRGPDPPTPSPDLRLPWPDLPRRSVPPSGRHGAALPFPAALVRPPSHRRQPRSSVPRGASGGPPSRRTDMASSCIELRCGRAER